MIDAHQHFWELGRFDYSWLDADELAAIRRNFLPEDLRPAREELGITHSIFVQTQHSVDENRWILDLIEDDDSVVGAVGWVDLASDECEDQLLEFKDHPKFVGIRHVTQDEPDDDFIIRSDVLRGLKVLEQHTVPFDLLFYEKHLKHAPRLAAELPELPMVIDHISKPSIKLGNTFDQWANELRAAAVHENIFCKLSGMITEADWSNWKPSDLKPYVETALDAFGFERCMFGSDWPVCLLAGSYRDVHDAFVEVVGRISDHERQRLFQETAKSFYRLQI